MPEIAEGEPQSHCHFKMVWLLAIDIVLTWAFDLMFCKCAMLKMMWTPRHLPRGFRDWGRLHLAYGTGFACCDDPADAIRAHICHVMGGVKVLLIRAAPARRACLPAARHRPSGATGYRSSRSNT